MDMRKLMIHIVKDINKLIDSSERLVVRPVSGKHVREMSTPLNTILYSKTGVCRGIPTFLTYSCSKKVQVGKDQEKTQSEKDSHSKNRGGKKPK